MPISHLPTPRRTALDPGTVRRLSSLDTQGRQVLSVYLGFDPAEMPNLRERRMELDSLLADAERRWGDGSSASHAERMALREDLEAVRDLLADDRELAPESARGLAIFCAARAGLCEVVSLPEPVSPSVALEPKPFVEPLLELTLAGPWCVLLVSRRTSRVFTGTRDHLVEVDAVRDDVHRRHAQGGWSQARYQRGVETEADWHVRSTCELLRERFGQHPPERLLIAGPAELHSRVEQELHPDLRARLAGSFEIDVERATPTDVLRLATPPIEADEQHREQDALARLEDGLAPGGHGAVGLDEVLESLGERRVGTLLLVDGLSAPGFACPSCGRLSTESGPCPLDGATPVRRADVVESAVELALHQDAQVLFLRHLPERLAAHGSIGALLRF